MKSLFDGLLSWSVREFRIHYEFFGLAAGRGIGIDLRRQTEDQRGGGCMTDAAGVPKRVYQLHRKFYG